MLAFLREFARSPVRTGAVLPSSRWLADRITESAALHEAASVIELGTGNGVLTEKILARAPRTTDFFALEINPAFADATRRRCPAAVVYRDDAVNARSYLEKHGHEHCDVVISGLPWASFGAMQQDRLLDAIEDVLKPGGRFLTFAYLQGLALPTGKRFRRKLAQRFRTLEKTRTVWLNVPPAFVYCAQK